MSYHFEKVHWALKMVKKSRLALMHIPVQVQNTKDEKKS